MLSGRPPRGEGPPTALFSRRAAIVARLPRVDDANDDAVDAVAADARRAVDSDGIVIADADGVVRLVNDRAAALLGVRPDAVEGAPLDDVLAVTNHDGVGWVACTRPYDGLVIRTGVPEQSWILPSGEEVLVTARIHRAPRRGPVTDVAVSLRSGRARARLDRDRSSLRRPAVRRRGPCPRRTLCAADLGRRDRARALLLGVHLHRRVRDDAAHR